MCLSMSCLRRDQHEQWKRHPEKPSRRYFPLFLSFVLTTKQCHFLVEIKVLTHKKITFSHSLHLHCLSDYVMVSEVWRFFVANCLALILSTQVSPQDTMGLTNPLELEVVSKFSFIACWLIVLMTNIVLVSPAKLLSLFLGLAASIFFCHMCLSIKFKFSGLCSKNILTKIAFGSWVKSGWIWHMLC